MSGAIGSTPSVGRSSIWLKSSKKLAHGVNYTPLRGKTTPPPKEPEPRSDEASPATVARGPQGIIRIRAYTHQSTARSRSPKGLACCGTVPGHRLGDRVAILLPNLYMPAYSVLRLSECLLAGLPPCGAVWQVGDNGDVRPIFYTAEDFYFVVCF